MKGYSTIHNLGIAIARVAGSTRDHQGRGVGALAPDRRRGRRRSISDHSPRRQCPQSVPDNQPVLPRWRSFLGARSLRPGAAPEGIGRGPILRHRVRPARNHHQRGHRHRRRATSRCRGLDEQLEIARKTVASRQKTVDLFKRRELGGVSNRVEVSQAEAELADAVAVELDTERLIANQETVVSLAPRAWSQSDSTGDHAFRTVAAPRSAPRHPLELAGAAPGRAGSGGVAAIGKRRDWRREGRLLPRISLTGLFGWVSPQLDKLLSEPQTVWSVGGNIVQPIFTGGRIKGNVQAAQARWVQSANFYLGTAQTRLPARFPTPWPGSAFSSRSASSGTFRSRRSPKVRSLPASAMWPAGPTIWKCWTWIAGCSWHETQAVGARLDHARTYISLYRALGGGWQVPDTTAAADSTSSK